MAGTGIIEWRESVRGRSPRKRPSGGLVQSWLELRHEKVKRGEISAKGVDNEEDCLNHFRDWVGSQVAVTVLDEQKWELFYRFVSGKVSDNKWSREFASRVFRMARRFLR
jgi:hypothetical protein